MLVSAVAAAGFPLFHLDVDVQGSVPPRIQCNPTSRTEPASSVWANNKISFVLGEQVDWVQAHLGENKEISVKWKLMMKPDDGII